MKTAWTIGLSVILAQGVWAGPLQKRHVVADPTWVLHLDLDCLKQTRIGGFLMEQIERPDAQAKLAAFQAVFNFDLRHNVRGATSYGMGTTPADGVLMLYGEFDPDRLETLAKGAKDYQGSTHRQYAIHSWIDKKHSHNKSGQRTFGAIYSSGLVVFGQKAETVARALDVLDNLQPGFDGRNLFAGIGKDMDTSFLIGATRHVVPPPKDPNSAVLKQSKRIALVAGETGGNLMVKLLVEANNEEVAKQVLSVGQGLIALISLKTDDPKAVKLAQSLSLSQDGDDVTVMLKLPAADVVSALKENAGKKTEER